MTVDARPYEDAAGQRLELVRIFEPGGGIREIQRERVVVIDLAGLAVAYKDDEEKIHRVIGLPLEAVSVETRIHTPV